MAERRACAGCGLLVEEGSEGCHRLFEALCGRDFGDPAFGGVHRMAVDAYTLQHPDRYCVSAKSLAAHLAGMCELIEGAGNSALPNERLRRWLDGSRPLVKPPLPADRGAVTIAEAAAASMPAAYHAAVRRWAASVWIAYAPLHDTARRWLAEALAAGGHRPRH